MKGKSNLQSTRRTVTVGKDRQRGVNGVDCLQHSEETKQDWGSIPQLSTRGYGVNGSTTALQAVGVGSIPTISRGRVASE